MGFQTNKEAGSPGTRQQCSADELILCHFGLGALHNLFCILHSNLAGDQNQSCLPFWSGVPCGTRQRKQIDNSEKFMAAGRGKGKWGRGRRRGRLCYHVPPDGRGRTALQIKFWRIHHRLDVCWGQLYKNRSSPKTDSQLANRSSGIANKISRESVFGEDLFLYSSPLSIFSTACLDDGRKGECFFGAFPFLPFLPFLPSFLPVSLLLSFRCRMPHYEKASNFRVSMRQHEEREGTKCRTIK